MDLKGVTWAGNIYQKFEAMCLEVEEAMYEDTVKYMENQVQKVGVSVKKFYSEVMDDLLTPCVDPLKADSELSLNYLTNVNKKTKLSKLDTDLTAGKQSSFGFSNDVNHLTPKVSSRVLVETTGPELCSSKSKKIGIQRRPIGIKRISQSNRPNKVSSSDEINVPSPLEFVARLDSGEAVAERIVIPEAPMESTALDEKISAGPVMQKKDDSECTSLACDKGLRVEPMRQNLDNSGSTLLALDEGLRVDPIRQDIDNSECDLVASEEGSSAKSARQEKDDLNCTSSSHGLPSECVSATSPSLSESASGNVFEVALVGKEVTKDNFDGMEMIENDEVVEPRLKMFDVVEQSKLEESCVFVEGDQYFVEGIKKQKSYKKKLREALSSKLMPGRKLKDASGKNNLGVADHSPTTMDSKKEIKSPSNDCDESDWELI